MDVSKFLASATATLQKAGVDSARLDVLILLEDELGRDRASILAHPELKITRSQELSLNNKIAQRAKHMPLAYIRGEAPFYGRMFTVSSDVLVPRPETESMIDLLKALPFGPRPHFLDVGTGSGCIGITAVLEIPGATAELIDIDPMAVDVAAGNAYALEVDDGEITCTVSNLLEKASGACDALLANLPYVPTGYAINEAAKHEPELALFAGEDGLGLYRKLWAQIATLAEKPQYVLTESLTFQHKNVQELAKRAGYRLQKTKGLIQQFAVI